MNEETMRRGKEVIQFCADETELYYNHIAFIKSGNASNIFTDNHPAKLGLVLWAYRLERAHDGVLEFYREECPIPEEIENNESMLLARWDGAMRAYTAAMSVLDEEKLDPELSWN